MIFIIGIIIFFVWFENNFVVMMMGWLLIFCEIGVGVFIIIWINELFLYFVEYRVLVIGVVEIVVFIF